ncbi:MAG: acyltransferase, partial [archaeon]|nr:acyltransferase [archaeon]
MKRLRLGFVQTNPVFGEKEKNVEEAVNLSRRAGGDLIVFPELFNTGYAFTSKKEAYDLAEEIPNGYT